MTSNCDPRLYQNPNKDCCYQDDYDLMSTLYGYYCYRGYPGDALDHINAAAKVLDTGDISGEDDIRELLMSISGDADMWAFCEGFRACVDIMSGRLFCKIFERKDYLDDNYIRNEDLKNYCNDDEEDDE